MGLYRGVDRKEEVGSINERTPITGKVLMRMGWTGIDLYKK